MKHEKELTVEDDFHGDKTWNPEIGLWSRHVGGHCKTVADLDIVHSGPEASMKLLVAAQRNLLSHYDVSQILQALRKTQIVDDTERHGAFKWYIEEQDLHDDHGVFFNAMSLLTLWKCYRKQLAQEQESLLAEMLIDSCTYCFRRVLNNNVFYPNEYLGYAICGYLSSEFFDLDRLLTFEISLNDAFDYLMNNGWGWGEHLSNIYGNICLDELAMLLLFSEKLRKEVREKAEKLFVELMGLDALFADGPRVPTIRDYSFLTMPKGMNYSDLIKPIPADITYEPYVSSGERLPVCSSPFLTSSQEIWYPLGESFYNNGWHSMLESLQKKYSANFPMHRKDSHFETVRCHDGIQAGAYIAPDIRMGSLSEFPLMPTMENVFCGLAWQCFPVSIWKESHLWAYPQWEALENGKKRLHPAERKYEAYLYNSLTDVVFPPIVGKTYCLQKESELLCLRIMPQIALSWELLCDRFRILAKDMKIQSFQKQPNWTVLEISDQQQAISMSHAFPVCWNVPSPKLEMKDNEVYDWTVRYSKDDIMSFPMAVALWAVSLDGVIAHAPEFNLVSEVKKVPHRLEHMIFDLNWKMVRHEWNVRVDLLSSKPLVET